MNNGHNNYIKMPYPHRPRKQTYLHRCQMATDAAFLKTDHVFPFSGPDQGCLFGINLLAWVFFCTCIRTYDTFSAPVYTCCPCKETKSSITNINYKMNHQVDVQLDLKPQSIIKFSLLHLTIICVKEVGDVRK